MHKNEKKGFGKKRKRVYFYFFFKNKNISFNFFKKKKKNSVLWEKALMKSAFELTKTNKRHPNFF